MSVDDNITVGLTEQTHELLQRLKEDGVFGEMLDGYRLGIALAVASELIATGDTKLKTVFNVGTLDPDGSLRDVIVELYPEAAERPYSVAERLAEAGVAEIGRLHQSGQLRFSDVFEEARRPAGSKVRDS